ncbi:MAG: TIGR01906 family membrane protein [Lachnospiraceae bacterium]|nr:TIGR01906 family membrane protein [Lachnospiraceae bacterium]
MKRSREIPFEAPERFRWTDIPTGIFFFIALVAIGLAIAVNLRPLYYLNISWLKIPESSGLNAVVIKENYNALIDYCSPFFRGPLVFPSIRASESGLSHFADVKAIFTGIYIAGAVSLVICVISFIIKRKNNEYKYLLVCGIITIVIPVLLVIFSLINFNALFLLFHMLVFSDNNWLFDPATDPIIDLLPETYFMECALIIAAVVIIGAVIVIIRYFVRKRNKKVERLLPTKKNYYY